MAMTSQLIEGFATAAGTRAFAQRGRTHPSHQRAWRGLSLSSVGMGTYLGASDDDTDGLYDLALERALALGLNVVDTAISYRSQRAERVIGSALRRLIAAGALRRDEVLVSTKAGFLPADGAPPADPHTYFEDTYFRPRIIDRSRLVSRNHCISARFLEDQLERSRRNLGLGTIDVFYLHNPEIQLAEVSRPEFLQRLGEAFAFLEQSVQQGKIRWYGTATWNGYRRPAEAPDALSLAELLEVARQVGGAGHHFAALQLPFNLAMREAYALHNQAQMTLLEAARRADLFVTTSVPILQGRLAQLKLAFPDSGLQTSAQHALQLVRSTPGVGSAIVGMRRMDHVEENARVALVPTLPPEAVASLMALPP